MQGTAAAAARTWWCTVAVRDCSAARRTSRLSSVSVWKKRRMCGSTTIAAAATLCADTKYFREVTAVHRTGGSAASCRSGKAGVSAHSGRRATERSAPAWTPAPARAHPAAPHRGGRSTRPPCCGCPPPAHHGRVSLAPPRARALAPAHAPHCHSGRAARAARRPHAPQTGRGRPPKCSPSAPPG